MKQTSPDLDTQLQEVGLLAFRAELTLERVQRRTAAARRPKPFAVPITLEEMDTIGDQLRTLSERWAELTDRVFRSESTTKTETRGAAV